MTTTSADTMRSSQSSAATRVAKVVEIIGTSNKSWEDAAQIAIEEAKKTVRGIRGVKIKEMTARTDPNTGRITEYRTCVYLSFGIIDEDR
jgi:flavin-binding protein dodecin